MDLGKAIEELTKRGEFKATDSVLKGIAMEVRDKWTQLFQATKPSWWGRMAMFKGSGGGGGFLVTKLAGIGYEIKYANKGKYNYYRVVEYGRPRFDMKPGLLASKRARMGKNGRYVIIAFTKNEDGSQVNAKNNDFNAVMTKIGTKREKNADGKLVTRNRYSYRQEGSTTGKGNAFISEQKNRNGTVHRSYMKFVVLSENSGGWYYPEIPAYHTKKIIEKNVKDTLGGSQALKQAIASDVQAMASGFFQRNLKK